MSSSLPVSDLDNPHLKKKMHSSWSRVKSTTVSGVLTVIGVGSFCLSQSNVSYADYMPKKSGSYAGYAGSDAAAGAAGLSSMGPGKLECTRSFDGKKPVNQYVVMIDAGSSGSRVHVYHFNNCGRMPVSVHEVFQMKNPGLSSYADEPVEAAKSSDSSSQIAVESVPEESQKCTPIAVMATAGSRALGEEKSSLISTAVEEHLEQNYPFAIIEDGVRIMSGDDEGVYAWVTANYSLGNIGSPDKTPTVAVFDLGGGSTQIVFEPTFKDPKQQLSPGDHRRDMNFGGRDFVSYQHSYLGYGSNSAVEKMNQEIVKRQSTMGPKEVYSNPCSPPGSRLEAKTKVPDGTTSKDGETSVEKTVVFEGPTVPSPLQCRALAEQILEKDHVCGNPPCSFGGVHQPRLLEAFPHDSDMYVFSYFYDRTAPLGMPSTFTSQESHDSTALVCAGESAYSAFEVFPGAVSELKKNPQWCTESSYMDTSSRTGYESKSHRDVKIAKKINNNELGWCSGASSPLSDKTNWRCRK